MGVSQYDRRMPALPAGTVTFVFTDIEDSTELLKRLGDEIDARVRAALAKKGLATDD